MLNLHLLECTLKGYDHISDLLLAKHWVITGCKFYGCSSLTSITLPNSVKSIGDGVFYGCSSLTNITIPNLVTYIGTQAFYGCTGLTSISIPNSVTSIEDDAFYLFSSLTSIYVKATTPPSLDHSFSDYRNITLYVPRGTLEAYKNANEWCNFENIQEYDYYWKFNIWSSII